MKCAICGQECEQADTYLGGYCCEGHREELQARHRRLLDELGREEVLLMPGSLGVEDFERLALKLAVHLLARMSAGQRQLYRQAAPQLLDPVEMAQELKGHVLRQLPASHVTLHQARGPDLLLRPGSYSFLRPVPAALLREALVKAGLLPLLLTPATEDRP